MRRVTYRAALVEGHRHFMGLKDPETVRDFNVVVNEVTSNSFRDDAAGNPTFFGQEMRPATDSHFKSYDGPSATIQYTTMFPALGS